MSPKVRFQLVIEPEQLAELRKIEEDTGAPVSAQIRRAIDDWLTKRGVTKKKPERKRAATRKRS